MSYRYASTLFQTAADAATACAFDYLTAMGGAPRDRLRELASMTDDELWSAIDEAEADGWRFAGDEDDEDQWSDTDVDLEQLRADIVRWLPEDERCYNCGRALATEAGGTFCAACVDARDAWDATDEDLCRRLGPTECAAWRAAAYQAGDTETVEAIDRAMGCCHCDAEAVERTCEDCGCTALVIDCGHHAQPAAISTDEHGRSLCDVCYSARVEAAEAAAATAEAREAATKLDDELPAEGPKGLIARAEGNEVLLADDLASVKLTIAQARALAGELASIDDDDDRFSSSWVWEWTTAHGISRK